MREHEHPQRFPAKASPGELLKRLAPVHARLRMKEAADSDPAYLSLLRQCPCLKCGMEPAGEAAHVRRQSGVHNKHGGMGKKPADRFAIPLCGDCHRTDPDALHQIGEDLFFHILGIDPLQVCERLYRKRGDFVAMRAATFQVISKRG